MNGKYYTTSGSRATHTSRTNLCQVIYQEHCRMALYEELYLIFEGLWKDTVADLWRKYSFNKSITSHNGWDKDGILPLSTNRLLGHSCFDETKGF